MRAPVSICLFSLHKSNKLILLTRIEMPYEKSHSQEEVWLRFGLRTLFGRGDYAVCSIVEGVAQRLHFPGRALSFNVISLGGTA